MIAQQFSPSEIDCLIKTAVELWEEMDVSDLSERQLEVLDRRRTAMYAEYTGQTPDDPCDDAPHRAGPQGAAPRQELER
ncbi:hypothetical protein [Nonomuraea jabiensis]|uniref:hypothetical protein n=1 Tax=Nonomuraea jabiensis TaxID=882448 RepID=UPI003D7293FA